LLEWRKNLLRVKNGLSITQISEPIYLGQEFILLKARDGDYTAMEASKS